MSTSESRETEARIAVIKAELRRALAEDRVAAALELARRVVDETKARVGERHEAYASALNDEAVVLKQGGHIDEAVATYERALQVYDKAASSSGSTRPHGRAVVAANLGQALRVRAAVLRTKSADSDVASAAATLERALVTSREAERYLSRELGETHLSSVLAKQKLANALKDAGRLDEAEQMLRAVIEASSSLASSDSDDVGARTRAAAENDLALVLKRSGRLAESRLLYECAARRADECGDARGALVYRYNLAELLEASGDLEAADRLRAQVAHGSASRPTT